MKNLFLTAICSGLMASQAQAASILVYGPADYVESSISASAGHTVTVWSSTQWAAASQSDFESYDAIVVGDKDCSGPSTSDFQTLYDTRATWGPAIQGNVVVRVGIYNKKN